MLKNFLYIITINYQNKKCNFRKNLLLITTSTILYRLLAMLLLISEINYRIYYLKLLIIIICNFFFMNYIKNTFRKPCVPLKENLHIRAKKERIRAPRQNIPTQVIVGKSTQEAREETQNENSVTKELDLVRRHLRMAWKNSQKDSIDYYCFVLHPKNFGESIENMFYVSFLIKDGYVRLIVDESTGLPRLKKLSREEKEQISSADRSALDTTQFVTKIDYKMWKVYF